MGQRQRKTTRRGRRGGGRARRLHEREISCRRRTTPRAWRCLRGWRRLCPSQSRRPYRLPVWGAMANEVTRQGHRVMGSVRERSLGQLESDRVSARKKPPNKNGGLGRQCTPGLRMAGLDETAVATSEKRCKGPKTQVRNTVGKLADALSTTNTVPCQLRHSGPTRAFGSGVPIVQRHANREFRVLRRSARGGDPWARRARRGTAAMKSDVIVKVSERNGQVAQACDDRGFKVKTWIPGGIASDHALFLLCVTYPKNNVF